MARGALWGSAGSGQCPAVLTANAGNAVERGVFAQHGMEPAQIQCCVNVVDR